MYPPVCPLRGQGLIPGRGGVFQGNVPWLITLCQPALSRCGRILLNLPQWHHATCGHQGERPKLNHGQTTAEIRVVIWSLLQCYCTRNYELC